MHASSILLYIDVIHLLTIRKKYKNLFSSSNSSSFIFSYEQQQERQRQKFSHDGHEKSATHRGSFQASKNSVEKEKRLHFNHWRTGTGYFTFSKPKFTLGTHHVSAFETQPISEWSIFGISDSKLTTILDLAFSSDGLLVSNLLTPWNHYLLTWRTFVVKWLTKVLYLHIRLRNMFFRWSLFLPFPIVGLRATAATGTAAAVTWTTLPSRSRPNTCTTRKRPTTTSWRRSSQNDWEDLRQICKPRLKILSRGNNHDN